MDYHEKYHEPCINGMSKKQLKKWCKKRFGSIKPDLPRPSKSMWMSKSGWVSF